MSERKFLIEGEFVSTSNSFILRDELEPRAYELFKSMSGYRLRYKSDIIIPEKLYDFENTFIDHVLNSWEINKGTMGIMLSGIKGIGKSLTAIRIALGTNLPIIFLDKYTVDSNSLDYLESLKTDLVIVIDEFDKILPISQNNKMTLDTTQDDLLHRLDPGYDKENNYMYLFTSNHLHSINTFLLNRPSRIRYLRLYEEMDKDLIINIIEDHLEIPKFKYDLLENIGSKGLNVDVLLKIIEEINISGKPYSEFRSFFNYKSDTQYQFNLHTVEGELVTHYTAKILYASDIIPYKGTGYNFDRNYHIDTIIDNPTRFTAEPSRGYTKSTSESKDFILSAEKPNLVTLLEDSDRLTEDIPCNKV